MSNTCVITPSVPSTPTKSSTDEAGPAVTTTDQCGALRYEPSEQGLHGTVVTPRTSLAGPLVLLVVFVAIVLAFFFRQSDGPSFLIVPLVILSWAELLTTGPAVDRLAVANSETYTRLRRTIDIRVRGGTKKTRLRFEIDGDEYRRRDYRGTVVASVPYTSVESRVLVVFRERVYEIAVAPRGQAKALADEVARLCEGGTAVDVPLEGLLTEDATFDMRSAISVLLVTLASPFVYSGMLDSTGMLVSCVALTASPRLRVSGRAQQRTAAYRAFGERILYERGLAHASPEPSPVEPIVTN